MRWVDRLIGILREQQSLVEQMIALLRQEREAVVSGDVSRILSVAKRKETLSTKQRLLEEAREACLKNAGKEGYTLSQLMEELAPHDRERLREAKAHLQEALDRLLWENKRNLLLINKAMELNRELLKLFTDSVGLSYDSNGVVSTDYNGGSLEFRG